MNPAEIAAAHDELVKALAFYADPGTYHAIAFFPDPPTGEFMDDFAEQDWDEFYDRPMPGARARGALTRWFEVTSPDGD